MFGIITLIIASLALIAMIVLIVIVLKRKSTQITGESIDLKELGSLSSQINHLSNELKVDVE